MSNLILWNALNIDHAAIRPIGPHQLAGWLRQHGYSVTVIDFCNLIPASSLFELTVKHVDNHTCAIGVGSTFWSVHDSTSTDEDRNPCGEVNRTSFQEPDWVMRGRELVAAKFPEMKWLLGGANSLASPLKYTWHRMHGHAENEILKFMDECSITYASRNLFDVKHITGCYMDDMQIQSSEVLPIELGRGCQFKCSFCRYPLINKKKNTYLRDYHLIKQEFLENFDRYGVTRYFFLDDTVNESDEKINALADICQSLPFKLEWVGYNRLDLIGSKRHTIESLKATGLRSTFFGIESFHRAASKIVGKGWNGVHGKEFLLELKERWGTDISFHLGFIAGLPEENPGLLDQTQQWCIDNDIHSWRFAGLSISRRPDVLWKSEFDTNYEKYGYRFTNPMSNTEWQNADWTRDTALARASELNVALQKYCRPAVFLLGELASMGYSFDELMAQKKTEMDWSTIKSKAESFVQRYVDLNLSAPATR